MRHLVGLLALIVGGAASAAQVDVAARLDGYWRAPRDPGTYRALAGLGDPGFAEPLVSDRWNRWEDDKIFFEGGYGAYCRTAYALKTYRARASELGPRHPYVARWLAVQKAVFSACAGWSAEERRPAPLPPPLAFADPRLARMQAADRAYQAASQLFYADRIDPARTAFAAIADAAGPHQAAARLMIAAIAAGSRAGPEQKPAPGALARAEALLRDPAAAPMREEAGELVGWLGATADTPATRRAQVRVTVEALHLPASTIAGDPAARERYLRAVEDLPKLSTAFRNQDWWLTGAIPRDHHGSAAIADTAARDRLVAFTLVPPCQAGDCGYSTALRSWLEELPDGPDRDAWRVVRLGTPSGARADWDELDRLAAQVEAAPVDHDVALLALLAEDRIEGAFAGRGWDAVEIAADRRAAADMLARWRWPKGELYRSLYTGGLRALVAAGQIDEARALRDRVEPRIGSEARWPIPGELLLLLAEDERAMVTAMTTTESAASPLLDLLPITGIERLARNPAVKTPDRARFARVAWVRAFVSRERLPRDLDQLMRALNPALTSDWSSKVGARTSDGRLLLDVLRSPGLNLRIEARVTDSDARPQELDVYQHSVANWWCGARTADQSAREEQALAGAAGDVSRAQLVPLLEQSWLWRQLDPAERARVAEAPMAPRLLAERALRWAAKAKASKPDGADEALALAVRATRYGCQMQGGHGLWSRAAYDLLHQRFPGTPAAIRTRWWFDCRHFTYGCTDSSSDDYGAVPDAS